MKTSLLSLFAGTILLAGSAIAGAGEPTTLTSAELDTVSAGGGYPPAPPAAQKCCYKKSIDQRVKVSVDQYADALAAGDWSKNTATATNTSTVTVAQAVAKK